MRNTLAALAMTLAATPVAAEPIEFVIDKSHQYIGFEVSHFGFSPVRGRFDSVDATLLIDASAPERSSVTVVIETASVDTDHAARDGHLRSADFFDVEAHPTMTFESTEITFDTPTSGRIVGDLTLLDATAPVALDFELLRDAPFPLPGYNNVRTLGFRASGEIKRSDWGMTTYVGEPIGDEVALIIQFDAVNCEGDAASAPSCTYGR